MLRLVVLLYLAFISNCVFAENYSFIISSGDTLSKYFYKLGLSNSLLINLISSDDKVKKLNNLKIGKKLIITLNNKRFKQIIYYYDKNNKLIINHNGSLFSSIIIKSRSLASKSKYKKYSFIIKNNISIDGKNANLNLVQIKKILKAIKGRINILRLLKGDIFVVFFNKNKLIALKYYGKKVIKIFNWKNYFYTDSGGTFYDMFLPAPLKYKRISSNFSYNRYHPILKINKPHRAVDYSANKGVRVFATSDGVVKTIRTIGALGNMVQISHRHGYSTVYAHLSKFRYGLYKGKKIKKGETIGYVGSTGRSTGNHLHYELKISNKYLNPVTHRPKLTFKLKGSELKKFRRYIKQFK